jgi:hypothetical protein
VRARVNMNKMKMPEDKVTISRIADLESQCELDVPWRHSRTRAATD